MFRACLTACLLALAAPLPASAGDAPASGELLPGWREAGGRHVAGLSIRLAPGWKTYWRAPGEGGIPPQFNWSGSRNLAGVEVRYPIPKVLDQAGIRSIGYDSDVIFPLIVTARDPSRPVALQGEIEIGVCEDICIPLTLRVRAELPKAGAHDAGIAEVLANQPAEAGRFDCEIEPIADGLRLRASAPAQGIAPEAVVIEAGEPGLWVSPTVVSREGRDVVAEVEMVPPTAEPFALARNDVRMTLIGGGRAVEMVGCD